MSKYSDDDFESETSQTSSPVSNRGWGAEGRKSSSSRRSNATARLERLASSTALGLGRTRFVQAPSSPSFIGSGKVEATSTKSIGLNRPTLPTSSSLSTIASTGAANLSDTALSHILIAGWSYEQRRAASSLEYPPSSYSCLIFMLFLNSF